MEQLRIKKNSKKGIQVSEDQENEHHSTSSIISWEKAQLIKDCLLSKHNEKIDPQFKNWVSTRRFNLNALIVALNATHIATPKLPLINVKIRINIF